MNASPGVVAAGLFLLGLALFLPALGDRDLWNPDEPRYAQVAREMAAEGEYLVPRLNGGIYMEKPPLFFWSILAAGAVLGRIDETATRLPSALAAAGAIVLTYAIGRRLLSQRAGFLAAIVLATCVKIVWQARFGQIDMLLTLLVTLAMWFWIRGYLDGEPRWYPLFFLATGAATLAKGPAGFFPPLLAILAFLAITRDRAAFGSFGLGRGVLLWALVVAAWLVPASLAAGSGFGAEIGLRQTIFRYFAPWHHQHPWYHYLEALAGDFLPWSLFLPTTAVVLWRESRRDRGVVFCACWVVVTLLFFSLSPAKRGVYVLTMYPGLAMLVGAALAGIATTWPRYRTWVACSLGALAAACGIAAAMLLIDPPAWPGAATLPQTVRMAGILTGLLGLGTLFALFLARGVRPGRVLAVLAPLLIAFLFVAMVVVLPRFDVIASLRPAASLVDRNVPPGVRFGVYPHLEAPILFYGNRYSEELKTRGQLYAFLGRPGRRWLVLPGERVWEFDERLPAPVAEVGVPHTQSWIALFEIDGRAQGGSRSKAAGSRGS